MFMVHQHDFNGSFEMSKILIVFLIVFSVSAIAVCPPVVNSRNLNEPGEVQVNCVDLEKRLNEPSFKQQPVFWGKDSLITMKDYVDGNWTGIEVTLKEEIISSEPFKELALARFENYEVNGGYGGFYLCGTLINTEIAKQQIIESGEHSEYLLNLEREIILLNMERADNYKKNCL